MTRFRVLAAGFMRAAEVIVLVTTLGIGAIGVVGPLAGNQTIAVTSGSMGPAIPSGSLIVVSRTHDADLRVGEIITVQLPSGALLTHRIVAISVADGQRIVTIRGDANDPASGEVVAADRAIGRVTAVVPWAGQYLEFLTRPAAIVAWAGIVTLAFLRRLMRDARVRRGRLRLGRAFRLDPAGIAFATLLVFVVPFGANSIRNSGAIFTTSASVSGNTFSSGTWGGSDYRSAMSGAWDTASTWERFNGSSWVAAVQAPTVTDTVITIQSGHVVSVDTDKTIDEVVVNAGGELSISIGVTLAAAAGPGTDIDVAGLVSVNGTLTIGAGADIGLESGGILDDAATINGSGTITGLSGTLQANGGSTSIGNPIALTAGLTITGSADVSVTSVVDGSGTLTKAGTGTLTLSAANTYSGITTISAGVLRIQDSASLGSTAGATTVASGAAIEIDGSGLTVAEPITSLIGTGVGATGAMRNLANDNTWSGAVTLGAGGATVASDSGVLTLGAISGATRPLTVAGAGDMTIGGVIGTTTGTLTKTDTGTLTLGAANTYTGLTTINDGKVRAQTNTSFGTTASGTTLASGAAIEIDGSGRTIAEPITSLIGTGLGGTGALRNLANTNSWTGAITLGSGGATIDSESGILTLGTISGATQTLTISGSGNTTAGVISTTSGSLVKNGSGTLTLSGANTFTGSTTINDGIVSIAADSRLGVVPTVPTPGHLTINAGQLTTTATFTLNANRGIAVTGNATFSVTGTLTYSGVIAGTGSVTKIGTGTLTLGAAANTYEGRTTISAGIISIAADSALGAGPGVAVPAHLTLDGGTLTTTVGFALNSDRGIAINSTGTITTTGILVYGGIIAGSGSLTKAGTGTLTLSGVNTYIGSTTISAGVVSIGDDSGLGTAPATATPGQLTIGTAALTTTTGFTLAATRGIALTGTATFTPTGTLDYGGIVDGTGALKKTGTGTLTLSGANTYTGLTTLTAGVIRIQNDAALGTTAGATTVASGAAIELDDMGLNVAESITSLIGTGVGATGAIRNLANDNTWSGAIFLGGTVTIRSDGGTLTTAGITATARALTVTGSGDTTIGGVIATTTGTLTKTGTGTLTLSGANTYAGLTTLSAGIIRVQDSAALGTTAGATTVASGAAIELDGTSLNMAETISSLIGTGVGATGAIRNLANDNMWSGAITLGSGGATVASDAGTFTTAGITAAARNLTVTGSGDTTVGGVIATTSGTLTKTGTGTLTLSAANTYTGITTVSAGQMLVDGGTGAGAATVASGATLGGAGTMAGAVTVMGTLAPGSSAARLTTGALTFSANSTLMIEIGGTTVATQFDQHRVSSGAVTIGSTVTLSLVAIGGFSPSIGETYQIVDKVAAGAISGTFNGLAEGATISNLLGSGLSAMISYVGGDGNDVVLTVIP